MQLALSTGVDADLETGWLEFGDQITAREVQQ